MKRYFNQPGFADLWMKTTNLYWIQPGVLQTVCDLITVDQERGTRKKKTNKTKKVYPLHHQRCISTPPTYTRRKIHSTNNENTFNISLSLSLPPPQHRSLAPSLARSIYLSILPRSLVRSLARSLARSPSRSLARQRQVETGRDR
jgi:hypothetical protein